MNQKQRDDILERRTDRLIAFFDAVVAIAITMLALEIAVPSFTRNPEEVTVFFETFTGYLISFVSLGSLWYMHSIGMSVLTLTGMPSEFLLHFILMFLITLFQPATKALCTYPQDIGVKVLYMTLFFAMYGVNIILLRRLRKHNLIKEQRERELQKRLREMYNEEKNDAKPEERLAMQVAYYVNRSDVAVERFQGHMSDEQMAEIEAFRAEREEERKFVIWTTVVMSGCILAAVVSMMFSFVLSYVFLGIGTVLVFWLRWWKLGRK